VRLGFVGYAAAAGGDRDGLQLWVDGTTVLSLRRLTSNSTELRIPVLQHISQHNVLDVHRANDQSPRPDAYLAIARHHA